MAGPSAAGKGRFVCTTCHTPFFALPPIQSDQTCPTCGHVDRYVQEKEVETTEAKAYFDGEYVGDVIGFRFKSLGEIPRNNSLDEKVGVALRKLKMEIDKSIEDLVGLVDEMLATMRINLDRGQLPKELEPLYKRWSEKHDQILGNA